MADDVANSRPAASRPCINWVADRCIASNRFSVEDITCFNEGNCDGFGTCRACSKYDTGGLKVDTVDADSGRSQTPLNLRMYNVRAKIKPCCFWDGDPVELSKDATGKVSIFTTSFPVVQDVPVDFFDPEDEDALEPTSSETKCTLEAAAPWQVHFTSENPTAYGCNGAKSECPFYTGPKFTEVVDEKLEYGDRVTAKQIMELRWYSADWASFSEPRAEWERRFENPDIWAWARDESTEYEGRFDDDGNPLLVKVTIDNFSGKSPEFRVDPPRAASTGTPTIGQPPNFPDLVRDLFSLDVGMEVVWPRNTSLGSPYIRDTFTSSERTMMVLVQINSDRSVYAVNMTKHPQGEATDLDFIRNLEAESPEDVILPSSVAGITSKAFFVPLIFEGQSDRLNRIKIFLDTGAEDESMLTAEIFVRHIFFHGEVAQTSFIDYYGHGQIEPWIDHFTKLKATADFLHLTGNTEIHSVLLNAINTGGKKTMYAIEEVETLTGVGEDNPLVSWEALGCNLVAITFKDPRVNRVMPWRAWGDPAGGTPLSVTVDRTGNSKLSSGEPTTVTLENVLSSSAGTFFPPYVAFFKTESDEAVRPFDVGKDTLSITYAYTEYKQAPIPLEDETKVKFPEDLTATTDLVPYDITYSDGAMTVEGVHVKLDNGVRVSSCEEILGECFYLKSIENEAKSQSSFLGGGLSDGEVKTASEMITECKEVFEARVAGGARIVHNNQLATAGTVADALSDVRLAESHLHFLVIFADQNGRPVGSKTVAFLTQSAIPQCRDVEIRYKWEGQLQHYPNHDAMILVATSYSPITVTTNGLVRIVQEYDPFCGDHKENNIGDYTYGAFDLEIDKHGPLWYPYTRCQRPTYHADSLTFTNVVEYEDNVEGFDQGKRRYYWERMRFFDQYMPAIRSFIPQLGCFWSERTTTVNVNRPVTFKGYTRIRSSHPFGDFNTDRESLRVSRHWEKRNLGFNSETIKQEDDGLTISLSEEAVASLFDPATQQLKEGAESETFIWTHINDGMSVVDPGSEGKQHPFSRFLLNRVGSHTFGESFSSVRLGVNEVFEERDYTTTLDRSEDGSKIYLPNGTTVNTDEGVVLESQGRDIRWVFSDQLTSWAWFPKPAAPERGTPRITGLFLSNPSKVFFKENRTPATYMEEGPHIITYEPHEFGEGGTIEVGANIRLDGGPPLYISQTDGHVFILADPPSPYDPVAHEGEDYEFVLHGLGPNGFGILADDDGLQRYTLGEEKFATYAGLNMNLGFNIDNLPYQTKDVRQIGRLASTTDTATDQTEQITEAIKEYSENERSPVIIDLNFEGHYYVERVVLDFKAGSEYDVPVIRVSGHPKEVGMATVSGTATTPASIETQLLPLKTYFRGDSTEEVASKRESFSINQRLFRLKVELGARTPGRKMIIENIQILTRDHIARSEDIFTYAPKLNRSQANTGTHKPSDLEFFYQRSYPDFAKDYLLGVISIADLGGGNFDSTKIPGVSIKWQGKRLKDIVPTYDFTDPINNRFPYNNIDKTEITGYQTETIGPNSFEFVGTDIRTSSKGWTMYTSQHYADPGGAATPNATGPGGIPNVQVEGQPNEDLQEFLYHSAGELLGDKVSEFTSFWHPAEIEFFEDSGVQVEVNSWVLQLRSTAAPLRRVFQHDSYGCLPGATHESLDGRVHKIVNWQAKGVFHYQCDPRYSWACFTTVMNKCEEYIFRDYGKQSYLDSDIINKYTYTFQFPPRDYTSWIGAGLINQNEIGGIIGGTGPIGSAAAASVPAPNHSQLQQTYNSNLPMKGPGPYQ